MLSPLLALPIALAATAPSFELSPTSGTYYHPCQSVDFNIMVNTNGTNSNSANIIINYDDAEISIDDEDGGTEGIQINTGSAYDNYASYTVDESGDRILMTGYNLGSPFSTSSDVVFGSFTVDSLTTGDATLDVEFTLGETTDSNIAHADTSADILNAVDDATITFSSDTGDPYLDTFSPAKSATDVDTKANVTFRIKDDECGVDLSDLTVTVDSVDYTNSGGNQFSASGSASNYLITVNPASDFDYEEVISVSISGEDVSNNTVSDSYSFTVEADNVAPTIASFSPAQSATEVSKTSNVTFRVTDSESGVNLTNMVVNVEGTDYTYAGDDTFGYSGNSSNYLITVNPAGDFTRGQTVDVAISGVKDFEDNASSSVDYSFDIVANVAPTLTAIADKSVTAGNLLTFLVQGSDSDGDTVTISMDDDNLPSEASYTAINSTSGIFTWQTSESDTGGPYNLTFTAADDGPGSVSYDEVVAVTVTEGTPAANTDVVMTSLSDQSVYAGSIVTLLVYASDSDGDTISFSATTTDQSALTLTDISNGLASLAIDSEALSTGANVITVTATDDGSPPSSDSDTLTVTVTALPTCTTQTCTSGGGGGIIYAYRDKDCDDECVCEDEEVTGDEDEPEEDDEEEDTEEPEIPEDVLEEIAEVLEGGKDDDGDDIFVEVIENVEDLLNDATDSVIEVEVVRPEFEVEGLVVEENGDAEMYLEGSIVGDIENADTIEVVWRDVDGEEAITMQRVKGRDFAFQVPDFVSEVGEYWAEVTVRDMLGLETESAVVYFVVGEAGVTDYAIVTVSYIPWWVLAIIGLLISALVYEVARRKRKKGKKFWRKKS